MTRKTRLLTARSRDSTAWTLRVFVPLVLVTACGERPPSFRIHGSLGLESVTVSRLDGPFAPDSGSSATSVDEGTELDCVYGPCEFDEPTFLSVELQFKPFHDLVRWTGDCEGEDPSQTLFVWTRTNCSYDLCFDSGTCWEVCDEHDVGCYCPFYGRDDDVESCTLRDLYMCGIELCPDLDL